MTCCRPTSTPIRSSSARPPVARLRAVGETAAFVTVVLLTPPRVRGGVPLDRRSFLATSAALAVTATGGCTGCVPSPTASLRMTAETDAGLASEALTVFDAGSEEDRPERERIEVGGGRERPR